VYPHPAPAQAPQLSDISVAGDPLSIPHLLPEGPRGPVTVADFAGLARSIADDRDRWTAVVGYDPVSRWYHRLQTGPGHDVWLLTWLPGQSSGLHDHGPSSGVLTVLRGTLTERSLTRSGETRRRLPAGSQRVFGPGYLHEAGNDTLEPVVSLHIYFPGLTAMTQYPYRGQACSGASPDRAVAEKAAADHADHKDGETP
jgi:quercetin dioxygenase-like cupin family protein